MWGNIKYFGMPTSITMHKAPTVIKDLEAFKVKHIFCSQTYAYVVTENDEIKHWGEWFYDRAKQLFQEADIGESSEEENP